MLDEAALCAWFGAAAAGDRVEYWRGYLAIDANPSASTLDAVDRRQLGRVAARAFRMAEQGQAHLVQRRHGDGDHSYLLVVRPRRLPIRARFVERVLNATPGRPAATPPANTHHLLEVA